MYNLVIADDEKNIREGLSRFIDWAELGFNVVMKCEDGDEVIDYINAMSVDVVLCDIRMSRKSGLDVAKYIFENSLNIKVVLMSGYQEFEYAKKALEYNVVSYIVKPIELEEIKDKFAKVRNDFDRTKNIKEKMQQEEKKAVEAQNIILKKEGGVYKDVYELLEETRVEAENNKSAQHDYKTLIEQQSHLIEHFLEFNKTSIYNTFKDISSKIVNIPFNSGLKFLDNTLVLLLNRIANSYIGLIIKEELKSEIRNIRNAESYSSALQAFEEWINKAVNAIEENNNSNTELIIKKANKYIEENYMDDLTLEKVAEVVFLSPVYLSKVYKKKMGINFIDYVTKIRIERSKELLSNKNLKVYEISNLVGYKNLKYFYKLFKNYTGYTPNTYREMLMKRKSTNCKEDK
ncbi:response regulator [Clostridium swellfunianum]|uniref:response regulator transcription factor n=1 Tax=Clostridium swellfunianum TaxID=1367462 RepID=UPI00202EB980|nr:response regulator [Clostridium swellfunianum]MCM0647841.1 response regulator [Clostridium swellfunianum]